MVVWALCLCSRPVRAKASTEDFEGVSGGRDDLLGVLIGERRTADADLGRGRGGLSSEEEPSFTLIFKSPELCPWVESRNIIPWLGNPFIWSKRGWEADWGL
mmetsp:Transcript_1255/g.1670  ORF Transcript_1255/g.1670 Transcript_1255/m.1670 type:complete len:102 (-) Transcript_1255:40-345(-)